MGASFLFVVCLALLVNLVVRTIYDLAKKEYWHAIVSLTLFSSGATVVTFGFRL